jgi:hypothetical protein
VLTPPPPPPPLVIDPLPFQPCVPCPFCREAHRSLLSADGGDSCNPFAEGPEKAPIDPLSLTIDMDAMLKEANRTRRL